MINKFQTGGNILQQLKLIFNALNTNPQETVLMLVKNGATPELIMQIVEQGVRTNAVKPEVASAVQLMFSQKARHGAKLNYIKSLKNKCAEDEELYYYKKGGSVGCGCKKKEDGGPLTDRYNKMKSKILEFKDKYKKKPKVIYPDPEAKKAYENNHLEEPQWYIQPSAKDSPKSPKNSKVTKKAKGGHADLDVLANLKPKKACNGAIAKFKKKCGGKVKK